MVHLVCMQIMSDELKAPTRVVAHSVAPSYNKRERRWCFTNFDLDVSVDSLENRGVPQLGFVIWQLECASSTQKKHQQGYLEWCNPVSLSTCKKLLPTAHWEIARGSASDSIAYCSKDEGRADPYVSVRLGEPMQQGKRNDIHEFAKTITDNKLSFLDQMLLNPHMFLKYGRNAEKLNQMVMSRQKVREPPILIWLQGLSETGKSTYFRNFMQTNKFSYYMKPTDCAWWDGYNNEQIVWIDEFDTQSVTYPLFLKMIDVDCIPIQVKGGMKTMTTSVFFVTSNRMPTTIFADRVDTSAMDRRLRDGCMVCDFHRPDLCSVPRENCLQCSKLGNFIDKVKTRLGLGAANV